MSIYKKDSQGKIVRIAGNVVQRWNNRIFTTTHRVEDNKDYYEIDSSASKYIKRLTPYTFFHLYFNEPNKTDDIYIVYGNQELRLRQSGNMPIPIGGLVNTRMLYTFDLIEEQEIWYDVDVPFKHELLTRSEYEDFLENGQIRDDTEYTILEEDGKSYARYIGDIPLATGGGTGGPGVSALIRLTPEPISAPTIFSMPLGTDKIFEFNYTHEESAIGVLYIFSNNVLVETKTIAPGVHSINLKDLVYSGSNTIRLEVKDYLDQTRRLNLNVTGLTISLNSTYDETEVNEGLVNFSYTVNAPGVNKKVHFQINNEPSYTKLITTSNNTEELDLPNGAHILKLWASSELDNITYTSVPKEFIILVNDGTDVSTMLVSKFKETEFSYGDKISIEYIAYNKNIEKPNILGYINNELILDVNVERRIQTWTIGILPVGTHEILLQADTTQLVYTIEVVESDLEISTIDDSSLETYLTSIGKSNVSIDRDTWVNSGVNGETYPFIMSGFNYASNGWINDSLIFNGNAQAVLRLQPFAEEVTRDGLTIELELETPQVHDGSSIISIMDDGIGLEVFGHKASLIGSNTRVDTYFSEDTKLKLTFVVSKQHSKVFIYVNGVLTNQRKITNITRFKQNNPSYVIFNENLQGLKLYNFRLYNRELNYDEVLGNYIYDIPELNEKLSEFGKIQIYDESGNVSIDKVKRIIPVMTITLPSELPYGAKEEKTTLSIDYENLFDDTLNFSRQGVRIVTQGTSTLIYPTKNFRLRGGELDTEPVVLTHGSRGAKVLNLKTDYVDSSVATNSVLVRLFEEMYTIGTPPIVDYPEVEARTTIYGSPVALFHNKSGHITFKGLYSLNNDKSEPAIYGHGVAPYEASHRFEIAINVSESAGAFERPDGLTETQWMKLIKEDFEAIYPKGDTSDTNYQALKEFIDFIAMNNINSMSSSELDDYKLEFAERVNIEYATKYFIVASMFGLLDSFGKNVQMNTWRKAEDIGFYKWYFTFYDLDTAIGLDNEGRILTSEGNLIYDYNIELEYGEGFAQANSKFWKVFTELFADEIKTEYQYIRSNYFTDDKIRKSFFDDHIYVIGRSIYNNSNFLKYVSSSDSDQWEYMLNGNRELQIKSWVSNRLKFLDSKYVADTTTNSVIGFRLQQEAGVPAQLHITPHFHQYVTVEFGARHIPTNIVNQRTDAFEEVTITSPHIGATPFMECRIYGADNIAEVRGFTDVWIESIQLQDAVNLLKLDLSKNSTYSRLETITLGDNKLLSELNLENLSGLTDPLQIPELLNLKKLNIKGTGIKEVELSNGGILEEFILNTEITDLTLLNQTYLDNLSYTTLDNLKSLRLENTPANVLDIIENAPNLENIRITDFKLSTNDPSYMLTLANFIKDLNPGGIDLNGNLTNNLVFNGEVRVQYETDYTPEDYDLFREVLPNVTILLTTGSSGYNVEELVNGEYEIIGLKPSNIEVHLNIPFGYHPDFMFVGPKYEFNLDGWIYYSRIGDEAFKDLTILSVTLPESITHIGNEAFAENSDLEYVYIPEAIRYIGNKAFYNSTSLKFNYFPQSLIHIGEYAFYGVNELPSKLALRNSVIYIGENAFGETTTPVEFLIEYNSTLLPWEPTWNILPNSTEVYNQEFSLRTFIFDTGGMGYKPSERKYILYKADIEVLEGWEFNGWKFNSQSVLLPFIPNTNDNTYVLIANTNPIEYTITYMRVEDTTMTNPLTYTVQDLPLILTDPIGRPLDLPGEYEFIRWRDSIEGVVTTLTKIGNRTLTAVWGFEYPMAHPIDDFTGNNINNLRYVGTKPYVTIPEFVQGTASAPFKAEFTENYNGGFAGLFSQSTHIKGFVMEVPKNLKSMLNFFRDTSVTELDLSLLDTSYVTDMSGIFYGCQALTELDISNFNTENVTNMAAMFQNCRALTELNVSSFNTENVTSMAGMFRECQTLTELDLSNFNTENVNSMSNMFRECQALTELDLSSFNTENVITMTYMFYNCHALTELDVSNFDTKNVNSMSYMFRECQALTELDLSSFNTENVISMADMFQNCQALTELDISSFTHESITNTSRMFASVGINTSPQLTTIYCKNNNELTYFSGASSTPGWVTFIIKEL